MIAINDYTLPEGLFTPAPCLRLTWQSAGTDLYLEQRSNGSVF